MGPGDQPLEAFDPPNPWRANQGPLPRPTSSAARAAKAAASAVGGSAAPAGAALAAGGGIVGTLTSMAGRVLPGMAIGKMGWDTVTGAAKLAKNVVQGAIQDHKNKKTHTKELTATSGPDGTPAPPVATPTPSPAPPAAKPSPAPAPAPTAAPPQPAATSANTAVPSGPAQPFDGNTGGGGPVQFHSDEQPTPGPARLARKRPRAPDLFPPRQTRKVARTTRSRP
jgi:hypothetical protein